MGRGPRGSARRRSPALPRSPPSGSAGRCTGSSRSLRGILAARSRRGPPTVRFGRPVYRWTPRRPPGRAILGADWTRRRLPIRSFMEVRPMQTERIGTGITARAARTSWSLPATVDLGGLVLPTRESIVIVVASLMLLVEWYHAFLPLGDVALSAAVERAVLYGLVPLGVLLLMGERPSAYGLR